MKNSLYKTIVNYFTGKIDYDLTIVDTYGIIAASTNEERTGVFNEFAYEMILSRQPGSNPQKILDTTSHLGTVPGVCCTFQSSGKIAGAIILEGNPENLYALIGLMRVSIEALCNRDFQNAISSENVNLKKQFTISLIYNSELQETLLEFWSKELGYELSLPRVPILVDCGSQTLCSSLMKMLKMSLPQQDILAELQEGQFFLFKTLPSEQKADLKNFKSICNELYENIVSFSGKSSDSIHLFVGNILENASDFSYGCHLCFWLYSHYCSEGNQILYIFDCLDKYLFHRVHESDLNRLFYSIYKRYPPEFIQKTNQVIEALDIYNYNISRTSAALFIHKNTLLAILDKIRNLTETDPIHNSADRKFLLYMIAYFKKQSLSES